MPLAPGTRIGGYEIVALLGAGGMGEVYRARDQRLGREVAIKILSSQIAADADAIARFEREARALAALNHPNIAAIYGVEDNAGQPALILELVDGETLADRLARGPVPIATAIEYARHIADALDAAHEAGIVHRDLKPGNIKVADDGRVKVLDFGLAKAIAIAAGESPELDPANTPTITVQGTKHGVILGTAAYMSPEQARGKRVDKRTDIWAFGCVLYEMLTGQHAFAGETTSDVIAAIITQQPDLAALPATTPSHVRDVLARCLEKDPKRRIRDIADVRVELDRRTAAPDATPRRVPGAALAAMALVTLVAVAIAVAAWRRPAPIVAPPAPIEFTFGAPAGYTLAPFNARPSPDGRHVAFVARDDKQVNSIFLRSLDTATSRRVDGTEGVGGPPSWSPDSRALAFLAGTVWKRVSIDSGPAVTIVADARANLGASWGEGDVLLLSPANRTSLFKVPIGGGTMQPVTTLNAETENSHRWPQLLPDGRHFLFTIRSDSPARLGIRLGSLDSTDIRPMVNVASQGVFVEPGWLLFVTPDQALMAQALHPSTLTLSGMPRPIVGPVRYFGPSFNGNFDASLDGRVLTYSAATSEASTIEWFDRTGKSLGRVGPERDYRGVRLSRDAGTIAVELPDNVVGTRDIWLVDAAKQSLTRFTAHPATDWRGVFSPTGNVVAFASDRAGASAVFTSGVANANEQTQLARMPGVGLFPIDWSADGKYVFAQADTADSQPRYVLRIPVTGGPPEKIFGDDRGLVVMPRMSPEGDRIAYASRESGTTEMYVASVRDRTRVRVSTTGGTNPVWGSDGKELFFVNTQLELMRVSLTGTVVSGSPQALFRPCQSIGRVFVGEVTGWKYDVSPDGKRFLIICSSQDSSAPSAINVIVNWQSRLKH